MGGRPVYKMTTARFAKAAIKISVNVIAIPLTLYMKRSFSIDTPKACTTSGKLGVEPIFPSDQLS
jgi:hypothetical protein